MKFNLLIIKHIWLPILFIVLSIWNLVTPFEEEGPIVIKFAKKNKNTWQFSQRVYSSFLLAFSIIYLITYMILTISFRNIIEYERFEIIRWLIILAGILLPIPITYIILRIKFNSKGNSRKN